MIEGLSHLGSAFRAVPPAMIAFEAATTRARALAILRRAFAEGGITEAALDARILLLDGLGIDAAELALRPEAPVGDAGARRLFGFGARRLAREPVSRILGEREFWGLAFELSPATLVPRPDTETVVETALGLLPNRMAGLRLLDLGTGSGCLLVALLHELPKSCGVGVDRSPEALATARRNARRNGVADRASFVASNWADTLRGRFDLVAANPPYVPSGAIPDLAKEVRLHDPRAALDGGSDGLDAYRAILAEMDVRLGPQGLLVLEIGATQLADVRRLAEGAGLELLGSGNDLGGRPRAVALGRSGR